MSNVELAYSQDRSSVPETASFDTTPVVGSQVRSGLKSVIFVVNEESSIMRSSYWRDYARQQLYFGAGCYFGDPSVTLYS